MTHKVVPNKSWCIKCIIGDVAQYEYFLFQINVILYLLDINNALQWIKIINLFFIMGNNC